MINARITFSNIQALDCAVAGVTRVQEETGRESAAIDDSVFEVPGGYEVVGGASENTRRQLGSGEEEELLLQYAIRQSLQPESATEHSSEQVDIWEALEGLPAGRGRGVGAGAGLEGEDRLLQAAIERSMADSRAGEVERETLPQQAEEEEEDELAVALRLSKEQERERQERVRQEEEELLQQVLQLSLQEK